MGRRILLAILTFLTATATARAQTGGTIAGKVSAVDGRALPGIQVSVSGLARGATTDTAGRFTIANVPAGTHTVQARGIGIRSRPTTVTVVAGQTATATFTLTPTATSSTRRRRRLRRTGAAQRSPAPSRRSRRRSSRTFRPPIR